MRRLRLQNRKLRQLQNSLGVSVGELAAWSVAALVVSISIYLALTVVALLPLRSMLAGAPATPLPQRGTAMAQLAGVVRASLTPTATLVSNQSNKLNTAALNPTETERGAIGVEATMTASVEAVGNSAGGPVLAPTVAASVALTATASPTVGATPTATATASPAPPTATATVTDTPTAKATPTVTATPTETASPTVTATPTLAAGWVFINTRLQPNPSGNMLLVYGEALNNTGSTQRLTRITGTFYDGQGGVTANPDQVSDYWPIEVVPQGGWVPFELTVPGIQDAASFGLSAEAQASDQTPSQNFEFSDAAQATKQNLQCVSANVKNNGSDLSSYLKVVVVLFDGNGKVINFSDPTQLDDLDEVSGGQSVAVEGCADPLDQTVARYEIQGWGH